MLHVFRTLEQVSVQAAEHIASLARSAVGSRGRFDWLLAGGRTPERTYTILARETRADAFWNDAHVYWGDERCVAPEHSGSNFGAAKRTLLDPIGLCGEHVHRIRAELADRAAAAREYEDILPARPDLLLLGMGQDGHIASLFPHSPALEEKCKRVADVIGPKPPLERITITPPVLASARYVMVLVAGEAKADALARVFAKEGDVHETPARLVQEADWFVDADAAAAIGDGARLEQPFNFVKEQKK